MPPSKSSILGRAAAILAARKPTPTAESAEEWAAKAIDARRRSFWSAKLFHAQHVADLKQACLGVLREDKIRIRDLHSSRWTPEELEVEVDPVTMKVSPGSGVKRGDVEMTWTRNLMIDEMRARAKERGLDAQAKPGRIRLIEEMAVGMSVGRAKWEEESADKTGLEVAPARRLVRVAPRKVPRDWETRWREGAEAVKWEGVYDKDGGETKIAMFNSPIWTEISAFGEPFPPFDYNSGMGVEPVFAYELTELGWFPNQPPPQAEKKQVEIDISDLDKTEMEWLAKELGDIAKIEGGKLKIGQGNALAMAAKRQAEEKKKVLATLQEALKKKQLAEAEAIRKAREEFEKKLADPTIAGADAFGSTLRESTVRVCGSTGAKVYVDRDGQKWVVKTYAGREANVANEYVANRLYAAAGVNVPEARLVRNDAGELGIASKWLDGVHDVGIGGLAAAGKKAEVRRGFATDAWLANWDVAGMTGDNIVKDASGKFYRVDQGGALLFRAQGSPKGAAFGDTVGELATLRDGTNLASAKAFGKLTDIQVARQIDALRKAVKPETIREIIAGSGMDAVTAAKLEKTLVARMDYMKGWAKKAKAAERAAKKAAKLTAQGAGDLVKELEAYRASMGAQVRSSVANTVADLRTKSENVLASTRYPDVQWRAMKDYTGSGYSQIIDDIRNGRKSAKADALNQFLDNQQLPKAGDGTVLVRGMSIRQSGTYVQDFGKFESGEWKSIHLAAPSSTSPAKGWRGNVTFVMRPRGYSSGAYLGRFSSCPREDEYLLGSGSNWYVSGVCNENGRYVYLLDELPPTKSGNDPRIQNGVAPTKYTFAQMQDIVKKLGGALS